MAEGFPSLDDRCAVCQRERGKHLWDHESEDGFHEFTLDSEAKGRRKMETWQQAEARYLRALHAVQSGVAMDQQYRPEAHTAKHVRVGIDSAHISQAALVRLLVAKGLFTMQEYMITLADETERERDRYQDELRERLGKHVTLG